MNVLIVWSQLISTSFNEIILQLLSFLTQNDNFITHCYVPRDLQNKADACVSLPSEYPLVEINFSNLLLSVVLKSLLAAHLVIYSPSADVGDTVTVLLLSLGLSVCVALDLYWLQVFWQDSWFCLIVCMVRCHSRFWWVKRYMCCQSHGKLWLVHTD